MYFQLCQVTLSLFELLVSLNCEDVMFWLVFRHLIPLRHLLPSKRDSIREPDLHGRTSQRFMALGPICTQEAAAAYEARAAAGLIPHSVRTTRLSPKKTSMTYVRNLFSVFQSSVSFSQIFSGLTSSSSSSVAEADRYNLYLRDARILVRSSLEASRDWQYAYDGLDPPPGALDGS